MAHTARSEEDKKEYFDSPEELEKKVDQLAALVKKSKHFIAFTVCSFTFTLLRITQDLYDLFMYEIRTYHSSKITCSPYNYVNPTCQSRSHEFLGG